MRVEDGRVTGNTSFNCVNIIKGVIIFNTHISKLDF